MAKKKAKKSSRSRSSSKGSGSKGPAAKSKAASKKQAGSRKPAAPAAPAAPEPQAPAAPEGGDSGAPDAGKPVAGTSLADLLPMSVARKKVGEIKARMEGDQGLLHICEVVFPNYEKHLGAYDLMKSYIDDCKTALKKGDDKKYDASKFTDGSDYTPLLKQIVKLNKAYKDAEESEDNNEELERVQKELDELKESVDENYKLFKFESERLTALVKDADGIEAAYAGGQKAQDDLMASTYFHPNSRVGTKKRMQEGTFTLATWYVNDSFKAIEDGDNLCEKIDGYLTQGAELLKRVNPSKE